MRCHRRRLACCALPALTLFLTALGLELHAQTWPMPKWKRATPAEVGMDAAKLQKAKQYALSGGGSGYITRRGKLVLSWGDPRRLYDLKSTTKSIGVTALGLAITDGKMRIDDRASKHHPSLGVPPESNRKSGWADQITIRHLATQTAGFEKSGGYTKLVFEPGTKWSYSDGGPNWLAECITLAYQRDLDELMFERVFTPLGISRRDLRWRNNAYRPKQIEGVQRREFGSGISANVDAMARIGYLYLRNGKWGDRRIIPSPFVQQAARAEPALAGLPEHILKTYGNASEHYGLLWWNNADGTLKNVPRDAYWSWGLYESLIVVIPSLDIVVARAGRSWQRKWEGHYEVLRPFFEPIVQSVQRPEPSSDATSRTKIDDGAPYPRSQVIAGIEWAPRETIIRRARGGDNWPITWGDDDRLYTAYGDGRGFKPLVDKKLSLGLSVVSGTPTSFRGINLRAPTLERTGNGQHGPKAGGIVMVDGVLYLLVRNVGNSQIVSSDDHGRTWHWSDWKFTRSFGCPTFLNYGKNYDGARDNYVYIYSHDSDSAYNRADRMVLARVPRREILKQEAYEFFVELKDGRPVWSTDIAKRGAVFTHEGHCFRSSVSYNAGLERYLWCQTGAGSQPRFAGGLAIYDAPQPWGPWTTVFYTDKWDVGPGETSCLPTKWMSDQGRTIHLVFSGDDSFSVRRARLQPTRR